MIIRALLLAVLLVPAAAQAQLKWQEGRHYTLLPGGQICVAEIMANATRTGPSKALEYAMHMLLTTDNGDAFTVEEVANLLKQAGFTRVRMHPGLTTLAIATKG